MSRLSLKTAAAAAAALALAACSDSPIQPAGGPMLQPSLSQGSSQGAEDAVVPGEVLLKLRDGESLDEVLSSYGASKKAEGYQKAFEILRTGNGNERALAAKLAADPRVEYAEPNYLRQPTVDERLWAFYNPGNRKIYFNANDSQGRVGQPVTSFVSVVDADQDNIDGYGAGGADVVIGSIDTGVDFNHPELSGRLIAGRDWIDGDNDPQDPVSEGHGTHTSGTMAGTSVGVAGVAGAAENVQVHVQRVCGATGCPTAAIVNAINAGTDFRDASGNRLVAMNLSLGGGFESQGEKDAISRATAAGILIIASAGNDGTARVSCPACDVNAISVAATNWKDSLAYYSNYGNGLDISAPGGQMYSNTTEEAGILSSVPAGFAGAVSGPIAGASYAYFQGTSMAAPQVTGTAAVVASVTGLRGANLRSRLLNTADDLGKRRYDTVYGNGRLNSYRAVKNTTLPSPQ